MRNKNTLVLGKDLAYSLNCKETRLNNNVLVVGAAGTGKTRGVVEPNILQAAGSYIITDPKGNLYWKYGEYLESKGYKVGKIDFVHPGESMHYNPFSNIRNEQDIHTIAYTLTHDQETRNSHQDEFWYETAEVLMEAVIAFLWERNMEITFRSICDTLNLLIINENMPEAKNALDTMMSAHEKENPDSYAVRQFKKFRVGAGKTLKSIIITADTKLGKYESPEFSEMFRTDECCFGEIGREKTAYFVVVSDHDRSNDTLVDLFFSQAMGELVRVADEECPNNELPVPVRFIMDDFATNCRINDFPRMIASIRSRRISTMLILQAESQLEHSYGKDAATIISNCDTYLYLGGNDIETAGNIARRLNVPLSEVLYMPVGKDWIFRRGQYPIYADILDLEEYTKALKNEEPIVADLLEMSA